LIPNSRFATRDLVNYRAVCQPDVSELELGRLDEEASETEGIHSFQVFHDDDSETPARGGGCVTM